jgi:hypothetical protein
MIAACGYKHGKRSFLGIFAASEKRGKPVKILAEDSIVKYTLIV